MGGQKGLKPWNWRGEPIVEPRGYVLEFVGKDHPLADVRGYAYQHRLRAYNAGLPVIGKEVHHVDEMKGNNAETNLEPLFPGEHQNRHRKSGRNLRNFGEENPLIECECGCGTRFWKYDRAGRPRSFVSGHNGPRNIREENRLIECKCGCGATFPKYDKKGRLRKFVFGHTLTRNGRELWD